ncbi:MAG TPA: hypothetical protein VIZ43_04100 [Trebonia sp.]
MLDAFYGAFSPACLALLGLWLVALQMRADEVRASPELSRRTYAVALFFALTERPGNGVSTTAS